MNIGILSSAGKNCLDLIMDTMNKTSLNSNCRISFFDTVAKNSTKINKKLNSVAKSEQLDMLVVTDILANDGSQSFKKYFSTAVASTEHNENTPAPKNYWKQRKATIKKAKQNGATNDEIKSIEKDLELVRKKAKIFSLNDLGNGCKGYCFKYKGIIVVALPKTNLTGCTIEKLIETAIIKAEQCFENSKNDYPNGFSEKYYVPKKTGFANRYIPLRGDKPSEVVRKCVVITAFIVFVVALYLLLYNMVFLSLQNAQLNGEIQKIAYGTEDVTSKGGGKPKVGKKIDWNSLKKINSEIVGWIKLSNTQIDYPVLWHKDDNRSSQYYLTHNYKGDYDAWGSVFLDYRCTKGTKSKNTVMHGHHMNDGSMFAGLMNYGGTTGNLSFYKKNPTITYNTPSGDAQYKIISVFKTNTLSSQGEFFNYMIGNFQNDKDFMNYVYNVRVRSLFNCPVDVNEDDSLITLSTCSYEFTNFRTVVVARKVRKGESTKVDVSNASLNSNAVWPQVYYSSNGGTRPTVTDFCTAYDKGQIDWYSGEYNFKKQVVTTQPSTTESTNNKSQKTTTQPTTQAKVYLTVKFINYDGSLINTQKVEYGKSAKAPSTPKKPSDAVNDYVFEGWQLDFSNVKCDMTIAPNFKAVKKQVATQGG